jgi:hypothetical protein
MNVYIFVSTKYPTVRAFTSDRAGGNLPAAYATWRAFNAGKALFLGSAQDPIADAISRDGFFLVSAGSKR